MYDAPDHGKLTRPSLLGCDDECAGGAGSQLLERLDMMIGLGQSSGEQVSCTSPSCPLIVYDKDFVLKVTCAIARKMPD